MDFKKGFSLFNNFNIRKKFVFIYFVCILIPISIIMSIYYFSSMEQLSKHQIEIANTYINKVKYDILKQLELAKLASDSVLSNAKLNEVLEITSELDSSEAWDNRREVDSVINSFLDAHWEIYRIQIYHTNPVLFHGGNFIFLNSEIQGEEWYQEFIKSGRNEVIYAYTGDRKVGIKYIKKNSDIQYAVSKISVIEMNMDTLNIVLEDAFLKQMEGKIFLVDQNDRIILTTDYTTEGKVYSQKLQAQNKNENEIVVTTALGNNINLNNWKLIATFPKGTIYKPLESTRNSILFLMVLSVLFSSLMLFLLSHSITYRLSELVEHMKKAEDKHVLDVYADAGNDEIGQMVHQYNQMVETIKQLLEDVYETGLQKNSIMLEKAKAEIKALQSQINPHFLYNVLNTIQAKCLIRGEAETAEIIRNLSKIFRRLTQTANEFVTISEEAAFINDYLSIQKYRFEDKIEYNIQVDKQCLGIRIPKMCIQPFVENASIHGVEKMKGNGEIIVRVKMENEWLVISIIDNGVGMSLEKLNTIKSYSLTTAEGFDEHIGITNVLKRLSLYYKQDFQFDIQSKTDEGTRVTIRIKNDFC